MPRASFGDRHTVTAVRGKKQVVFDFESKVIDFVAVKLGGKPIINYAGFSLMNLLSTSDSDEPIALLTLCEDELVGIDLQAQDWPTWRLPYLYPLHASPISAAQHVADVSLPVWDKLWSAGKSQAAGKFKNSPHDWPIQGGKNNATEGEIRDLLITG